jgi:nitrate/TMAO reductase-like tetraheme cytochrome c subunit
VVAKKRARQKVSRRPAAQAAPRRKFDYRNPRFLITSGIILIVAIVAFFPIALATDQPTFCRSCHGMTPFYDAWTAGPHATKATCIDCHVNAGYPSRFLHKFVALQEVYAQFFTNAKYPNYNAEIPNTRCIRCHPDALTKAVGSFRHADHLSKGVTCARCHAATGHKVTFAALSAAGLLNATNAPSDQQYVGQNSGVGAGSTGKGSVYPGHASVPCQSCHDQANLQCSFCHTAPAQHYGPQCTKCHSNAAVPFKQFTHPPSGEHRWESRPCVKCHPNGYDTVYCTCHKGHPPTGD